MSAELKHKKEKLRFMEIFNSTYNSYMITIDKTPNKSVVIGVIIAFSGYTYIYTI